MINSALPSRELKIARQDLIGKMIARVHLWNTLKSPAITSHRARLKVLVAIADDLKKAAETACLELRKLGVETDIKRLRSFNKEHGIPISVMPFDGRDVAVDLYRVASRANYGLRAWNQNGRPGRGRPRSLTTIIADGLKEDCRTAGLTNTEFSDFLSNLSSREGLPDFTEAEAAAKKRTERSKRSQGTK